MSIQHFDDMKLAIESLSGGRNTVIFDDLELPSVMIAMPKMTNAELMDGGTQQTHFAWIVDNDERDVVYISKYLNITFRDRAYSLPNRYPRNFITFDQAMTACRNKGQGHHLTTNALYAAIALLTRRLGIDPRGNNNWGRDFQVSHERGEVGYVDSQGRITTTLTGSGPASWYHDFTKDGIADLNGLRWEWSAGLRLERGEIQIIPYGNAMKPDASHAPESTLWRAILQDGTLVAPGTANTLKLDGTVPGNANETSHGVGGGIQVSTSVDFPQFTGPDTNAHFGSTSQMLNAVTARDGVTIPNILPLLGLFPSDLTITRGRMWLRNYGERLPLRGGAFDGYGSGAGVFALAMNHPRVNSWSDVGFRSAFVNL